MSVPLSQEDARALKSLLSWWGDLGVEAPPVERAARPAAPASPPPASAPQAPTASASAARAAGFAASDAGEDGRALAAKAGTLEELRDALDGFEGCALRATASNLVFSRGNPAADVMIVGEAPGREEDEQGKPFVGRSGKLLDRMLAAIGLDESNAYITNIVNWRPPGNRKPTDAEIEACRPFVERHIALVDPKVLVLAGGISAQALLRAKTGIMSLRGRWTEYRVKDAEGNEVKSIPALPIFHPAFLLRRPQEKAKAWRDMLSLQEKLESAREDAS
ncbi:uracil-DNA glycosylase [Marinicauda salina]|uniref:Type-4 uracil-DNA glycosylase n=1 Tax=Marinicauda salina TaxID=2135793 RepID=A0A2U2BUD5_9PROT|nr:uracil-DNA glycosylase [Marinicauda salina]PWE17618.1 uracil-DNA glycosylase [Marinicauda salina]